MKYLLKLTEDYGCDGDYVKNICISSSKEKLEELKKKILFEAKLREDMYKEIEVKIKDFVKSRDKMIQERIKLRDEVDKAYTILIEMDLIDNLCLIASTTSFEIEEIKEI